ncbi:TonB-dependent receptor domain-containing protein [Hyunsoonleella pacifica]|uniref:TonB-dependent receptor n=1 Tax=Hyunsoonleella pacifica TaxID=1080224 RepID=A0A4Q9FRL2_9FLAO|nr:TonB-dependent receptor [Hyunsoonleella pacifica]TBN18573.1 TonB-dependent receptor [Hyunsoonleella pacifica]GGD02923.1 TonB-dependent receptor [Hyunsoonleella pacifica]
MKLKVYSFIICCYITLGITAQSFEARVLDKDSNKPIEGVQVYTKSGKFIGFTDTNGNVDLSELDVNVSYNLIFFEYNYKTYKIDVILKNTNSIIVTMEPLGEKLSEVVLSYKKKEAFGLTKLKPVEGIHIYAGKKSEVVLLDQELANKSTNNARQIYAKVAGLNIYDSNDGGLQLNIGGRGLDPNRTANFNTRQNDYDISADVLGYPESYYTPPTEALDRIQIIRGAASLQYGTQFGGLVNFKFRNPSLKPIEFITRNTLASFGTYTNFTSLSGTKNKFKYSVFYNGKTGDGFRPNSSFDSNNAYGFVAYQFNDKTSISAEYTYFHYLAQQAGGLSDVQFLENPKQSYRTRNWFEVDWNLFNLKLNHKFSNNVSGILSVFALDASRKAIGFRTNPLDENANIFDVNSDEVDELGNFDFERDLIVGDFKNFGAEARIITEYNIKEQPSVLLLGTKFYKANNTSEQGPGSKGTDADFSFRTDEFPRYPNQNQFEYPNLNLAFFGENIFNINDKFSITPGFRFEYIKTESQGAFLSIPNLQGGNPTVTFIPDNNNLERNFLLLGVGLSYKPKPYFESYFNFSQNYRSVTFSDIRTVNPSFVVDPEIQDETGYTIDLGVRGTLKKIISYDVNVFSLLYDNRIGQIFSSEPPYRAQWVRGNVGKATILGLESLIQWNLKETFFKESDNLKLEVFSNLSLTTSEYSSTQQGSLDGNKIEFIPEVNFRTGVSFGCKDFIASLQYSYLSEQFTDATNSPYNPNNDDTVDGAIPAYNIMDLSTSYTFSKNFRLEVGINNLLDNNYFTRRATGYPGPGIIPSAPRNWYTTLQIKL